MIQMYEKVYCEWFPKSLSLLYFSNTYLMAEEHTSSGMLFRYDILSFLDKRLSFFLQKILILIF